MKTKLRTVVEIKNAIDHVEAANRLIMSLHLATLENGYFKSIKQLDTIRGRLKHRYLVESDKYQMQQWEKKQQEGKNENQ